VKEILTLIKLHQRQLDKMRREMAILEDGLQQLIDLGESFEKEIRQEQAYAKISTEAARAYGIYAKRVIIKRERIKMNITEFETKIGMLNGAIREEFAELKKYETLRDIKMEEQKAELARKERIEMDEMAIMKYLHEEGKNG
jgi:flagellar export protein FliJ